MGEIPVKDMELLKVICQAALCNPPTLMFSYNAAQSIIDFCISGDFVECGVYAGAQCAAMALPLIKSKQELKIHLFDSFEGIPQAGPYDSPLLSGQSVSSLENTKHFMDLWGINPDLLVYHRGWFKDTIPDCAMGDIAILRLDGDLYESTKICLEHLYPKLVEGGICIIDDYALAGCRRAVDEYFTSIKKFNIYNKIEGGGGPVWFRKLA